MKKGIEEIISIPQGVEITLDGHEIAVKGKEGTIKRMIANPYVKITKKDDMMVISSISVLRKSKRMLYTVRSHINNMMHGVQHPYIYRLKICAGHFPITIKAEGTSVVISNFLGEKIPRRSKILPGVTVKIDKDTIAVQSPDLEAAGQTAANLEKATGVGKRDRRVFQDGCYITEKPGRTFA